MLDSVFQPTSSLLGTIFTGTKVTLVVISMDWSVCIEFLLLVCMCRIGGFDHCVRNKEHMVVGQIF